MKIFLVGMPGSGKTYFGKRLKETLDLPLFDLDQIISEAEQKTVTEIFTEAGESHFRLLEHDYLKKITHNNESFILSTGGGTPCFHGNMDFMNSQGLTIFLFADRELLIERISRNDKRPLMKEGVEQKVDQLLQSRTPIYQQAHFTLFDREMEPLLPQLDAFFKS